MSDEHAAAYVDRPRVMSVQAEAVASVELHLTWSIGYAPEPDADESRFLLAHLHIASSAGTADIDVAGELHGDTAGNLTEEDETAVFEAQLTAVNGLSLLYFTARTAALGVLGLIEAHAELPAAAPVARLARLVRADVSDETLHEREAAEA